MKAAQPSLLFDFFILRLTECSFWCEKKYKLWQHRKFLPNSLSQLRNQVRKAMWEKLRKGKERHVHKMRVVKYGKIFPQIYKSVTGKRSFLRHFS